MAPRSTHAWPRLSWWAVLAELPAVAALAFNLWASVLALLVSGLGSAACGDKAKDAEEDGGASLPAMIRPGYSPPLLTNALWGAASGSACAVAWALFTTTTFEHGLNTTDGAFVAAATTTPGSALAFALGFAVGLYRLARWRLFVGDFLREVHRVEEMKVLDQILSQLSREKAARNSRKSTATEASDSVGLADEANLAVLDFGGGKGKTSAHMARHPAVDSVRAIDIDAHPPHVEKYDGRTIPFADGRFDLAVCLYVFHHIPHTRDLVQQLARKAKHVLIFEDLPEQSSSPLVARLTFCGHFLLFDQSVHTHLHHSTEEWRRLLADEWGSLSVLREFRIPPTAALPYERVALYCEAK